MLHRAKVMQVLTDARKNIFKDNSSVISYARNIWNKLCTDQTFLDLIIKMPSSLPIAQCHEELAKQYPITDALFPYTICAIDGSQVYPDRHQGSLCCLINVGTVRILYDATSKAYIDSHPHVLPVIDTNEHAEWVDCKRQEFELMYGFEQYKQINEAEKKSTLLLFDGSFIFWHLQNKLSSIKEHFMEEYQKILFRMYEHNMQVAWFISMPHSAELMHFIRRAASLEEYAYLESLASITDAQLLSNFLTVGKRTAIFSASTALAHQYYSPLKPYFFYAHYGSEIVRIEIPAWIAQDISRMEKIAALIGDQVQKGYGYPISLAEAHEQAVVKGSDREFFYRALNILALQENQPMQLSQKIKKKMKTAI